MVPAVTRSMHSVRRLAIEALLDLGAETVVDCAGLEQTDDIVRDLTDISVPRF